MKAKYWWIMERRNPQLGVYYVAYGNMPVSEARTHERPLYGDNVMIRHSSEKEYVNAIAKLKASGAKFI